MRTEEIVALLELAPHPEGGFYKEIFRDPRTVSLDGKTRAAVTCIHFLLPAGTFSALHRVQQTEIWHHLAGDPVELHVFENGSHRCIRLGEIASKQHVVPARVWQAAVPIGDAWSLCGCTVAPGFDFEDFEMPARDALLRELPAHHDLVRKLTRS